MHALGCVHLCAISCGCTSSKHPLLERARSHPPAKAPPAPMAGGPHRAPHAQHGAAPRQAASPPKQSVRGIHPPGNTARIKPFTNSSGPLRRQRRLRVRAAVCQREGRVTVCVPAKPQAPPTSLACLQGKVPKLGCRPPATRAGPTHRAWRPEPSGQTQGTSGPPHM